MIARRIKKNVEYARIEDDIRSRILSGKYPEGKALPGEIPLCREYGVSRKTIRKALENLHSQNYIRKHQGSGNFVIPAGERENMPRITGKICVMLPDKQASSPFAGELLAGIYKAASAASIEVRIFPHDTPVSILLEMYHNFECDAFIWGANPEKLPDAINKFARMKIPQVLINEKAAGAGSILYDSLPAWRSLLNTLHACGHKTILFIDHKEKHFWTQMRQDAFLQAAEEYEMDGTVFKADTGSLSALAEMIGSHPEITSIITVKPLSDAFLKVIAKMKKHIPENISWAEFSFGEIAPEPDVARIYIPVQKMGSEAVRLLSSHNFQAIPDPNVYVPCFSVMGLSIKQRKSK